MGFVIGDFQIVNSFGTDNIRLRSSGRMTVRVIPSTIGQNVVLLVEAFFSIIGIADYR
jgi:hypothetical protein